jgi:ribosomal protein S27AE
MTDAQMGLFDATTGADVVLTGAGAGGEGGASGKFYQMPERHQHPAEHPREMVDRRPEIPAERRAFTTEVWGTGPDGAYHHTNETVYYVVEPDELPREHLPDAPCVCGGRRFIAKEKRLRYWRCIRCVPPCPGERVAVYDVPVESDGVEEAEHALQLPGSALPKAPCHQCGGTLFAADAAEEPYRWRCVQCHPPGPDGGIVIYNVSEESDDTDDT